MTTSRGPKPCWKNATPQYNTVSRSFHYRGQTFRPLLFSWCVLYVTHGHYSFLWRILWCKKTHFITLFYQSVDQSSFCTNELKRGSILVTRGACTAAPVWQCINYNIALCITVDWVLLLRQSDHVLYWHFQVTWGRVAVNCLNVPYSAAVWKHLHSLFFLHSLIQVFFFFLSHICHPSVYQVCMFSWQCVGFVKGLWVFSHTQQTHVNMLVNTLLVFTAFHSGMDSATLTSFYTALTLSSVVSMIIDTQYIYKYPENILQLRGLDVWIPLILKLTGNCCC